MTAETDLLPMPWIERYAVVGDIAYPVSSDPDGDYVAHDDHAAAMQAYARANVAHATAAKDGEIEALRAEAERLRMGVCGDACLHIAIERDQLKARAERLEEALRAFPAEPNPYTYRIAHAKARAALDPTAAQENDDA